MKGKDVIRRLKAEGWMRCHSQGAYRQCSHAGEVTIECHLECLRTDDETVPESGGDIEDYRKHRGYAGGTWVLVGIAPSRPDSKARRVNIAMPDRALTPIDKPAKREGGSRSGFPAKAAFEYIRRRKRAS